MLDYVTEYYEVITPVKIVSANVAFPYMEIVFGFAQMVNRRRKNLNRLHPETSPEQFAVYALPRPNIKYKSPLGQQIKKIIPNIFFERGITYAVQIIFTPLNFLDFTAELFCINRA